MRRKIIAFDLDDVLCRKKTDKVGVSKYLECEPIPEMINIVNECYDKGMEIKIYTARGMETFSGDVSKVYAQIFEMTTQQLQRWGVKYTQLVMGKANYDLLIDDKSIDSREIKSFNDIVRRLEI